MPRLLLLTYQFVHGYLTDQTIDQQGNLARIVSGHAYSKNVPGEGPMRKLVLIEDLYTVEQVTAYKPDFLLVYAGEYGIEYALTLFASMPSEVSTHLVTCPCSSKRKAKLLEAYSHRPSKLTIHPSACTGAETMKSLLEEFLSTGSISDPNKVTA